MPAWGDSEANPDPSSLVIILGLSRACFVSVARARIKISLIMFRYWDASSLLLLFVAVVDSFFFRCCPSVLAARRRVAAANKT
jgi:hypothetical protein